jgi:hypothetical protein
LTTFGKIPRASIVTVRCERSEDGGKNKQLQGC